MAKFRDLRDRNGASRVVHCLAPIPIGSAFHSSSDALWVRCHRGKVREGTPTRKYKTSSFKKRTNKSKNTSTHLNVTEGLLFFPPPLCLRWAQTQKNDGVEKNASPRYVTTPVVRTDALSAHPRRAQHRSPKLFTLPSVILVNNIPSHASITMTVVRPKASGRSAVVVKENLC